MNGFKLTRADPQRLAKKYPNQVIRSLYQFPLVGVLSHWTFQGLLYMDRTERLFKLGLDVLLIILLFPFFLNWMTAAFAMLAAIFTAHSLNFVFNSHPWTALKLYGGVKLSPVKFERYIFALAHRASQEPSIESALAYGSLVREEWQPASDLDVRLVRKPGFVNGMRACAFLLTERTRAFIARFPLDAYLLDSDLPLSKLREYDKGIDLFQLDLE